MFPSITSLFVKAGAAILFAVGCLQASEADPFADLDASAAGKPPPSSSSDPFAGLDTSSSSAPTTNLDQAPSAAPAEAGTLRDDVETSFLGGLFGEGFSFKKEIMAQVSHSSATDDEWSSRNSIGFEVLKKFSTATATVAAFDVQVRLVRRDNFHDVLNDMEGADREGWFLEYHNLYWDFYNVFNPWLSDEARGRQAGRFNFRVGRFYLPFGLNLQTDTHGTVLQLSNERNFGFERDWYAGFWGSINADLNYDLYYLLGSGYDVAFEGQQGLIGSRLSLSNKYLNEYGIEGGLSFISGQRLSEHALDRSPSVALLANNEIIDTLRYGGDLRWRHPIPTGSITLTAELSAGRDERDNVFTQLYQTDYLTVNRKFGASVQYRRFNQDIEGDTAFDRMDNMAAWNGGKTDASVIGEVTWYFRNDIGNTNLHWIKLNIERETETQSGPKDTIITLQYYRYW